MLVTEAREFAKKAHAGIFRPNKARQLYSAHIREVASLVIQSGGTDAEVAAAWLHDTVEDTGTTIQTIHELFGAEVAEIVDGLTDKPDIKILSTLQRKLVQAERVKSKSNSVKRVKIADGTSNLRSVQIDPPTTWDRQKTLDYIVGCGVVAHMCRDISRFLDAKFYTAYNAALTTHF